MGVLIKRMRLPDDCYQCPMCFNDGGSACRLMSKPHAYLGFKHEGRKPDCPLVEVPTPHGRIVDIDAVLDGINGINNPNHDLTCGELIKRATIIEAEE